MTKTNAETRTPRVETLIAAAHRDRAALERRRDALRRSGIGEDHLPDQLTLMSFSLLGDHEREGLLVALREHWAALQSKGLAYGAIDRTSTAELRLLAHVRGHTEAIGTVWQQLLQSEGAPEPPRAIWRCARRVRGLWGEAARLHFRMDGVRNLLIDPDPVFGLQPALVAADPDGQHTGVFEFPLDNGEIRISLLHRGGEMYRHVVEAMVEEVI
jgi:hypothetical protein